MQKAKAAKTKKTTKSVYKKLQGLKVMDFELSGWLRRHSIDSKQSAAGPRAQLVFFGKTCNQEAALLQISARLLPWQLEQIRGSKKDKPIALFATEAGPLWILRPQAGAPADNTSQSQLVASPYAKARDLCGAVFIQEDFRLAKSVSLEFIDASDEEKFGALVGLEIGSYSFKMPMGDKLPKLSTVGLDETLLEEAAVLGSAVNLARHLTNLPASHLNPKTYARAVKQALAPFGDLSVDIWEDDRLAKEKMELLRAVGAAAQEKSCLVHMRYRPKVSKKVKPLAFVGKGITFDSGGLDIKSAAGMRQMKKDMAGSASLVGTAFWVAASGLALPCDFYLALAENAISDEAFRPGDIIRARNGLNVEIHNTDAEGRLVLADAIDVAVTQEREHEPDLVINLATLTGAMRVALGTELFGMFANNDALANNLLAAARARGESGWRMPLVKEYEIELKSVVADLANASNSGFGGAITAALFLERFVRSKAWAHLDMYGWSDRVVGALQEIGANGQAVQTLTAFLKERAEIMKS